MSAQQYRTQPDYKRKQRIDADKKSGTFRAKEADKRAAASKSRAAAAKSKIASTITRQLREAERCENDANTAAKEAARWQSRAADFAKQEANLQTNLSRAELAEAKRAEQAREREQRLVESRSAAEIVRLRAQLRATEVRVEGALRDLPAPKFEPLRILMLGASADGGLRVAREQQRIRRAVASAKLRDEVELDTRPSATTVDLLDGLAEFQPHVVHFSGHSDFDTLEFEEDRDDRHDIGQVVSAAAFASAIAAVDTPPQLVLLNSCNSAAQIDELVDEIVPFAIGMADEIDDGDAIIYAVRFYTNLANGQSIAAAHMAGRAALELNGVSGADLPTLASAADVDPATTFLVKRRR